MWVPIFETSPQFYSSSCNFFSLSVDDLWKSQKTIFAFRWLGLNPLLSFFSFESSCSFFPTEKLPDFSFYFTIMLLNQMIQFRFLLLRLKKKGKKKKACAVGFSKHFTLFSSRPCQLQCSNSSQSGSTTPNPIPPGFSCWPTTKTWLQLYWPLTSLTLSFPLFWCWELEQRRFICKCLLSTSHWA